MRIGIDLGGTKTEIIALHQDNGIELYRQRVPTPKGDYKATVKNIAKLVDMARDTVGQNATVGIGIPGTVSKTTGLVKNANSTWLNGNALDKDLEQLIKTPVRVQNDANCFAVSEANDGAGKGHEIVFGVIIGTGCGAGIAINGKPVSGLNGIAGEWGHNPLPLPKITNTDEEDILKFFDGDVDPQSVIHPIYGKNGVPTFFSEDLVQAEYPGPQCYCGKRGCLEKWISGPGFKADYERVTGEELSTHDIIAAANKGEERASAALDRYIDRLARGLASIVNVLDPDIIVLGGGMSNVDQLYSGVPAVWDKYVFSDTIETKIAPPRHGDSSGVRGAAWLW